MTHDDRWLAIELRHFATLEAIAQEGSFRAAARRLGYVQSAISRQVAYLEDAVGAELITRSRGTRAIQFTPAGEAVLALARDILSNVDATKAEVRRQRCHRPA